MTSVMVVASSLRRCGNKVGVEKRFLYPKSGSEVDRCNENKIVNHLLSNSFVVFSFYIPSTC